MKKLNTLLFLAGCTSSSFVFAGTMGEVSTLPSVFFELSSGYSFPFNENLNINVPSAPVPMVVDLDGSAFFAAEVGYRFHPNISAGLQTSYRPDFITKSYNANDVIGDRNIGSSPEKALTFMFNGYLNANSYNKFTPYITGGIGVASTWLGDINVHNEGTNEPVFYQPKGRETRFAWQAGAGINYEVTQHIALDLRGTFIDFSRSKSKGTGVFRPQGGVSGAFPSTDYTLLKYNAFELGGGLVVKVD
ncbi:outer membrane protein [Legionella bozemanae]|uniref:Outer membrane protein PagN n=1 Tax=Legionella bozemanae TaxID=447 RepID=A0A0W0RQI1_LEGBO|nr:outer membrane beta-barrel protein [Legionella bozemanae]KTC73276.1 Outer membrane protein PagN precursor [Legionella bozemanae]STO34638.1 Adhesin/invasin protein PagN [Legionella bozemanae]